MSTLATFAHFVAQATVPQAALDIARGAFLDTLGVTLAGAVETSSRLVQKVALAEGGAGPCRMVGTGLATSATGAALANGSAAHALDYDDMCFVSLAHPSAPLVAAALALGEKNGASGRTVLEAYVVGFEVECVLGRAMNPRHYQNGWHCTSTLGTVGAAAAAARILGLEESATAHCLAIAASEASGLKENFGTMTKPLHAGLAARNGILAALLAQTGFTAAERALDGPQGFLTAMSSEKPSLEAECGRLGQPWEILKTGITVKLYPSCAATHPALDVVLDLRRQHGLSASQVASVEIEVDSITPTLLIYDRPKTGLEGKFSMPFCIASALVDGHVGLETFEAAQVQNVRVQEMLPRIAMRANPELGKDAPALTQANVTLRLGNGQVLERRANGARGYFDRPASQEELEKKFSCCALRAISESAVEPALNCLREMEKLADIRLLTKALTPA